MIFDIHTHISGVEYDKNGNYLSPQILNTLVFRYFIYSLGFSRKTLSKPGIDRALAERFLSWINDSSIDKVVLLAYDAVYTKSGELDWQKSHMITGNDYIAGLAAENEKILFGASIHPYRKDAVAELERVIEKGACLIKWLPTAQDIDLGDPLCVPFYDALVRYNIPLLCHTGTEKAVINLREEMNNPEYLKPVLDQGVTVIAAHCGSRCFFFETCHFEKWKALIEQYDNLYGDISAFALPGRVRIVKEIINNPKLSERLLYGSDVPVITMSMIFGKTLGLRRAWNIQRLNNPFEKAYLTMKEVGIPETIFSRAADILLGC